MSKWQSHRELICSAIFLLALLPFTSTLANWHTVGTTLAPTPPKKVTDDKSKTEKKTIDLFGDGLVNVKAPKTNNSTNNPTNNASNTANNKIENKKSTQAQPNTTTSPQAAVTDEEKKEKEAQENSVAVDNSINMKGLKQAQNAVAQDNEIILLAEGEKAPIPKNFKMLLSAYFSAPIVLFFPKAAILTLQQVDFDNLSSNHETLVNPVFTAVEQAQNLKSTLKLTKHDLDGMRKQTIIVMPRIQLLHPTS